MLTTKNTIRFNLRWHSQQKSATLSILTPLFSISKNGIQSCCSFRTLRRRNHERSRPGVEDLHGFIHRVWLRRDQAQSLWPWANHRILHKRQMKSLLSKVEQHLQDPYNRLRYLQEFIGQSDEEMDAKCMLKIYYYLSIVTDCEAHYWWTHFHWQITN